MGIFYIVNIEKLDGSNDKNHFTHDAYLFEDKQKAIDYAYELSLQHKPFCEFCNKNMSIGKYKYTIDSMLGLYIDIYVKKVNTSSSSNMIFSYSLPIY